jgi:hypothetical protein
VKVVAVKDAARGGRKGFITNVADHVADLIFPARRHSAARTPLHAALQLAQAVASRG